MTSIFFLTENIWRNQFGSNYLKNEKLFLNYFLHFRNLYEILNICKKKDELHSWFICQITHTEKRG